MPELVEQVVVSFVMRDCRVGERDPADVPSISTPNRSHQIEALTVSTPAQKCPKVRLGMQSRSRRDATQVCGDRRAQHKMI